MWQYSGSKGIKESGLHSTYLLELRSKLLMRSCTSGTKSFGSVISIVHDFGTSPVAASRRPAEPSPLISCNGFVLSSSAFEVEA
jgi:hypothetical protein